MGNTNDEEAGHTSANLPKEGERKKFFSKDKISEIILTIVIELAVMFIAAIASFSYTKVKNFFSMPEQLNGIQNQIDGLVETTGNTQTTVDNYSNDFVKLRERLIRLETLHEIYVAQIEPTKEMGDYIVQTFSVRSPEKASNSIPQTIKLGTNEETNETCNFEDFIGKEMFIPYKNNGQDVLFYGKFNENFHWDDNCIINVYSGDTLVFVMDAEYDDGKLRSYKQIFSDVVTKENDEKFDVWIISNREYDSEDKKGIIYYSGETWYYYREENYVQQFELDNATPEDMINVDDFKLELNSGIERYYKGKTAKGLFNDLPESNDDNKSDAQLVIYNSDGNVRYLYTGGFKDGKPYDSTGNAWSFGLNKETNKYYYYKGGFDGERSTTPVPWPPATQEEIEKYVDPEQFNCSLKGLIDE